MEKTIFRRDEDAPAGTGTGLLKNIFNRKRKDQRPLISLFDEHEKSRFIRHLFGRDSVRFNSFMLEMNNKTTWPDTYAFIEAELKKRNIDILSNEAKALTDRIFQVYYPGDSSAG